MWDNLNLQKSMADQGGREINNNKFIISKEISKTLFSKQSEKNLFTLP